MFRKATAFVAAALSLATLATAANAVPILFKGTAIITGRTNTPSCVAAYDVGESFSIEYRPNATPEMLSVVGPDGGFLVMSTDANPSLRGPGTVRIQGIAFAAPVGPFNATTNFTISPATITAATPFVTAIGSLPNAGLPGCTITFRVSLAKLS